MTNFHKKPLKKRKKAILHNNNIKLLYSIATCLIICRESFNQSEKVTLDRKSVLACNAVGVTVDIGVCKSLRSDTCSGVGTVLGRVCKILHYEYAVCHIHISVAV